MAYMDKISKFRELFHDLPNCINGIHVIAYTVADQLENINYLKTKRETIKLECVKKVNEIDNYRSRMIDMMNELWPRIGKLNLPQDCYNIQKEIHDKYNTVCSIMADAKGIAYDGLEEESFEEDRIALAKVLHKFDPLCQALGELVKKLKSRLIELNKYYTVTD